MKIKSINVHSINVHSICVKGIGVPVPKKGGAPTPPTPPPDWISNLVARYSAVGVPDGLPEDGVWKDLSGNGRDLGLYGFIGNENSGFHNGELYFDGIDDGAYSSFYYTFPTSEYTVIVNRKYKTTSVSGTNLVYIFSMQETHLGFEMIDMGIAYSVNKSAATPIQLAPNGISWQTSGSYNGQPINKMVSKNFDSGFAIGYSFPGSIKDVLIFDKDLTPEQITEVITYYNIKE